MSLLDLTILDDERISLASWATENSSSIKCEIKLLCELARWVTKEADLLSVSQCSKMRNIKSCPL